VEDFAAVTDCIVYVCKNFVVKTQKKEHFEKKEVSILCCDLIFGKH